MRTKLLKSCKIETSWYIHIWVKVVKIIPKQVKVLKVYSLGIIKIIFALSTLQIVFFLSYAILANAASFIGL